MRTAAHRHPGGAARGGGGGATPQALATPWNTRFGIYSGSESASNSPPDFTGIAYTNANFPSGFTPPETWPIANPGDPPNVFNGSPASGSTPNYGAAKTARTPYQAGNPAGVIGNPTILPSTGNPSHTENGQSRRLVVSPIVNCQSLCDATGSGSQTVPVLDYACVLMLSPLSPGADRIWVEYRGLANDLDSPCGSFGFGGGTGPLVPVLVQ